MSDAEQQPRGNINSFMDVPYPRKIWDSIRNSMETLQDSVKEKITTQIESIESQTKSDSPNRQIVSDGLKSIHGILQAIPSAHGTVTSIISNLDSVLKSLGVF